MRGFFSTCPTFPWPLEYTEVLSPVAPCAGLNKQNLANRQGLPKSKLLPFSNFD